MSADTTCCQSILAPTPSPFEVHSFGWWDGPVDGMARCRSCGRTYHFEMIAEEFETADRVYRFAESHHTAYARYVEQHSKEPASREEHQAYAQELARLLRDALGEMAQPRFIAVAAAGLELEILGAKRIQFDDWRAILGLP